jgi:hypothetical protein
MVWHVACLFFFFSLYNTCTLQYQVPIQHQVASDRPSSIYPCNCTKNRFELPSMAPPSALASPGCRARSQLLKSFASREARCRSVEPYVVVRRSRRSHLDPCRRLQPAVEVTIKAALAFLSSSLALGCLCALSPTCAGTCHLLFEPRAIVSLQSALRYRRSPR